MSGTEKNSSGQRGHRLHSFVSKHFILVLQMTHIHTLRLKKGGQIFSPSQQDNKTAQSIAYLPDNTLQATTSKRLNACQNMHLKRYFQKNKNKTMIQTHKRVTTAFDQNQFRVLTSHVQSMCRRQAVTFYSWKPAG